MITWALISMNLYLFFWNILQNALQATNVFQVLLCFKQKIVLCNLLTFLIHFIFF